jgi:hypothetical protein
LVSLRDAAFRREFEAAVAKFTEALEADPDLQIDLGGGGEGGEEGGGEAVHTPLAAAVYAERGQCLLRMHR